VGASRSTYGNVSREYILTDIFWLFYHWLLSDQYKIWISGWSWIPRRIGRSWRDFARLRLKSRGCTKRSESWIHIDRYILAILSLIIELSILNLNFRLKDVQENRKELKRVCEAETEIERMHKAKWVVNTYWQIYFGYFITDYWVINIKFEFQVEGCPGESEGVEETLRGWDWYREDGQSEVGWVGRSADR